MQELLATRIVSATLVINEQKKLELLDTMLFMGKINFKKFDQILVVLCKTVTRS